MEFLKRPTIASMTDTTTTTHSPSSQPDHERDPRQQQQRGRSPGWPTARTLKQFSLYVAGATFLTASILLSKRTVTKRHLALFPKPFTPSNQPAQAPFSGALEAVAALNLATLNVSAFGIMMVGGFGWAFDISTVEELRRKVRGGMGADGTARGERELDEEFEEWIAGVLERKAGKEERGRRRREEGGSEEGGRRWVNERGRER